MSGPSSNLERARTVAQAALAAMARHGVAPTPRNFAVWYAHESGENPELSRTLESIAGQGQALSEQETERLYMRFLAEAQRIEGLAAASDRLDGMIAQVLAQLGVAGKDATRYSESLSAFAAGLSRRDIGAMQAAVETMVSETSRMAERNQALENRLRISAAQINTLRQDLDDLRRVAELDALTGIANRKTFDEKLHEAGNDAARTRTPVTLIMVDIDHFKRFNDNYGHQFGDEVLRLVARVLREGTKGRDIVARYGGEEFAVILPETPLESGLIVAEQLRENISRRDIIHKGSGEKLGRITMSLGVATFRPGEPLSALIARADQALYHAKRSGRDRVASERDLGPRLGAAQ